MVVFNPRWAYIGVHSSVVLGRSVQFAVGAICPFSKHLIYFAYIYVYFSETLEKQ